MTTTDPLLGCDENAATPPRLQQIAAAQLSRLYGDADYIATPARWDAAALLARAARPAHPRLLDPTLHTWLQQWEEGDRAPVAATDDADRHDTDRLARAALAVHGHLHGPTLTTAGGLELAAGDTVILDWDRNQITALGHAGTLDTGMLADVIDVDADNRTIGLWVGIAGVRLDLRADSAHAAGLSYAYTELDDRTSFDRPTGRADRDWEVDIDHGIDTHAA